MNPKRWKQDFNAIGISPGARKHSAGTFAHKDIAFEFASWLNPEFKLYLIVEFQRLKEEEQIQIGWTARIAEALLMTGLNYVAYFDEKVSVFY